MLILMVSAIFFIYRIHKFKVIEFDNFADILVLLGIFLYLFGSIYLTNCTNISNKD